MKLHALPLSPPPPPPAQPPARTPSLAETAALPFQAQAPINAVQPSVVRRGAVDTRGNAATPTKQAASRVATPILDVSDAVNSQAPYRRGALLDISA